MEQVAIWYSSILACRQQTADNTRPVLVVYRWRMCGKSEDLLKWCCAFCISILCVSVYLSIKSLALVVFSKFDLAVSHISQTNWRWVTLLTLCIRLLPLPRMPCCLLLSLFVDSILCQCGRKGGARIRSFFNIVRYGGFCLFLYR